MHIHAHSIIIIIIIIIYSASFHVSTGTLDMEIVSSSNNRHKLCYVVSEMHLYMIINNQVILANYLKVCIMYKIQN
jgi:hypothetical protein